MLDLHLHKTCKLCNAESVRVFEIDRTIVQIDVLPYRRLRDRAETVYHVLALGKGGNLHEYLLICPMMRTYIKDSLVATRSHYIVDLPDTRSYIIGPGYVNLL